MEVLISLLSRSWNSIINNLEIIEKLEASKGLFAKIDDKRTAYSINAARL